MDVEIKISDLVLSIEIFLCIYILNKIVFFELMANILKSNHLEKKFLYLKLKINSIAFFYA